MFEAEQVVNQMPIGRHATHSHDGSYPCPNDLLLGRASPEVPQGPFMERVGDRYRLDFIQRIVQSFWKKRTHDYFPGLIIRLKKHMERRNVKERKVMLIQDSNWCSSRWLEDWHRYWSPSQPRQQSSTGHCIIQEWCQGDTTKYTSVERTVHRLMVLVLIDDEDWMLRTQTCTFLAVWSVLHRSHSEWTETELSYKSCD